MIMIESFVHLPRLTIQSSDIFSPPEERTTQSISAFFGIHCGEIILQNTGILSILPKS